MITNDQLAELASLARAATPGPWRAGRTREIVSTSEVCIDTDIGPKVLLSGNSNFIADGERDAAFAAAANPVTVLALLARIAELEKQRDAAQNFANCAGLELGRVQDERDHWKANHDNQVQRARILIERGDMPLERVKAYERYTALERDATRYRALRRGQKWSVVNGIGDMLRAEILDSAIDAAMEPPRCTCPSGDGSLRWPCPRHPPESA
ncbi:hypothetical protein [Chromobacterium sp. LK1]|uniref:hypothetical protein n=1 Tax=Chromobacterium sp. LK1 TaxID=1628193 RepID=UPI00069E804D|nr:hypothetical protein [Chromobacterium sp. LK1]